MKKVCFKCGEVKGLSEFYEHDKMKDGHLGKCKDCTKKDTILNRNKNSDYYRNYEQNRAMLPNRVEARRRYRKTDAGKQSISKSNKKYVHEHPFKYVCHTLTGYAIRKGKLVKPDMCISCGSMENIYAHHSDYTKPYDIIGLCPSCHREWHKKNKPFIPEGDFDYEKAKKFIK